MPYSAIEHYFITKLRHNFMKGNSVGASGPVELVERNKAVFSTQHQNRHYSVSPSYYNVVFLGTWLRVGVMADRPS